MDSRWAITRVVLPRLTSRRLVLDRLLGTAVQGRGRFVEDQERRGAQDGAGDGDPLLLAARELQAALAHQRVVAIGKAGDEVVELRRPAPRLDFVRGRVGPAEGDVVDDACR